MAWTRRDFLSVLGVGAISSACRGDDATDATTTTTSPTAVTLAPVDFGVPAGPLPFTLGVASGDPDTEGMVVWTRVERPATAPITVIVEIALDAAFTAIVQRLDAPAEPDADMTVRVTITGLDPDTRYWYRFALDGHVTPAARTRTAPEASQTPASLTVGHVSCQRYSSGYWTALTDLADTAPDVVVHCGDYVYESDRGGVRPVEDRAPTDLEGYRALWRRYRREPELQAAHTVAPWLMVWDDHEVENDYQGVTPGDGPGGEAFLAQRAAAYRVWWEYTPTRIAPPVGPAMPIHRVVDWGRLTRFVLLDTRQYRDDQPCDGDLAPNLGARCDESPTTTMLGDDQEAWFADVAPDHGAIWTTVVQQVVVHQWRFLGGNVLWNLDQWDGYPGARRRFLETLAHAPDPVVLTGDVHSSWVADLRVDFDDEDSEIVGAEFVAPGVSSAVPSELGQAGALLERQSPHIRWSETRRRGWVLHTVTPETWSADHRLVEDASVPDSEVRSAVVHTIRAGSRGVS